MDNNPFRQREREEVSKFANEPPPYPGNLHQGTFPVPTDLTPPYELSNDKSLPGDYPDHSQDILNNRSQQSQFSQPPETRNVNTGSSSFLGGLVGPSQPSRNPLDPLPPALVRPISQYIDPRPFPPLSLTSYSHALPSGFPRLPPACEAPLPCHPFSTHDVPEADWIRFLEDIAFVASLTVKEKVASKIPRVMHIALPLSFLVSRGLERKMKVQRVETAADLIETWNELFFQPRHIHVILVQGSRILAGSHLALQSSGYDVNPEAGRHRSCQGSSSSSDSSSSDSSSDDSSADECRHHKYPSQREEKRARREERREGKRARREERRQRRQHRKDERREKRRERKNEKKAKKAGGERYRLIVVSC